MAKTTIGDQIVNPEPNLHGENIAKEKADRMAKARSSRNRVQYAYEPTAREKAAIQDLRSIAKKCKMACDSILRGDVEDNIDAVAIAEAAVAIARVR